MPGGLDPEKLSTPSDDCRLREAGDGQPFGAWRIREDQRIETADSSAEEGICTILEHECDDAHKSHAAKFFCEGWR